MGLTTRKNQPFATTLKNQAVEGENIVFIKGGATIIEDRWIQFDDLRIDVAALINKWIKDRARRIFNKKNGFLYILITLNQNQVLEVVPSISLNQTVTGRVTSFESLSGKLPLVLVRLEQDGSNDLSSYIPITRSMIEIHKGYGNFTLRGSTGFTGPMGDTGSIGIEGIQGLSGISGGKGLSGNPGITGPMGLMGDTGPEGAVGAVLARRVIERDAPPIADFVGLPQEGTEPLTVQFTNLSTGTWESLHWDFGDGSSSTNENPSHTYQNDGTYTVSLYLQMTDGESEEIKYDYIVVAEYVCFVQNVVNASNPSGGWQSVVDSSEDGIQNVVGDCTS
jgi:PKD repeat protein